MSTGTSIEWTDATWNPTRGCTRVSEGCRNCYAERFAARMPWGQAFAKMTPAGPRWTGVVRLIPEMLDVPLRWKKPRRIFVNSMSDLFHESLSNGDIARVFFVMGLAERHTFQILTKRPDRMRRWVLSQADYYREKGGWPLPNVWLGTSVEDQATANARIVELLHTPAAKRFVSYEPALGPVDFDCWVTPCRCTTVIEHRRLDWVIVGGESGPGARPFDVAWARSAVRQCARAGVACFVKQMGSYVRARNDQLATDRPPAFPDTWPEPEAGWDDGHRGNVERLDDGYQGAPVRIRLQSSKGGDPAEWPEDLRVREFPA